MLKYSHTYYNKIKLASNDYVIISYIESNYKNN